MGSCTLKPETVDVSLRMIVLRREEMICKVGEESGAEGVPAAQVIPSPQLRNDHHSTNNDCQQVHSPGNSPGKVSP
jgi:hypothetical protein